MKLKYLLSLTVISLMIGSCGNNSTEESKDLVEESNSEEVVVEEEIIEPAPLVELNNGEKWKANPETTEGINRMMSIISVDASAYAAADYNNLGQALSVEKTQIFENCTMEGEAHNQLHNYLQPLIDMINDLKEKSDVIELEATRLDLLDHLYAYADYFE